METVKRLIAGLNRALCALWRWRWRIVGAAVVLIAIFTAFLIYDFRRDEPEAYFDDPEMHFKYGSTGGDRVAGVPVGIWNGLPQLCGDYLPGEGWESIGLITEPDMDRPIGVSRRRSLGFDRVFLNCAACHVGTYRDTPDDQATIVVGMPANGLNLSKFVEAVGNCGLDERFNPWQVVQAAEDAGAEYSWYKRILLQYVAVPALRELLLLARHRFRFLEQETESGPGRFDTFNPAKVLLNWPLERLPERERVGIVDLPSLWLQGPREGMQLHWDGNNTSVEERNRSASFGTGGVPRFLDRESLSVIADYISDVEPPRWPFDIDQSLAQRGQPLYRQYCAECHGTDGRDFVNGKVGQVDPIESIRTDPCRLDNYTYALAVEQNNLYAGYPEDRFKHFRKTHGYANMPLDGLWLRGPYLHNGSVPTVRDLLEPAELRPKLFYRGYDVIDRERLGFVSTVPSENGRDFFRFETQCIDDPSRGLDCTREVNPDNRHDENVCVPGKWAGNSNRGHDGPRYGTHLPAEDKDAIVEYLKTF